MNAILQDYLPLMVFIAIALVIGLALLITPFLVAYQQPDPARTEAFRKVLTDKEMLVFVRYSRGQDVMAACGQLALLQIAGSA